MGVGVYSVQGEFTITKCNEQVVKRKKIQNTKKHKIQNLRLIRLKI